MNLARELSEQVAAYVEEHIPLEALSEWLDVHAQELRDDADAGAWALANRAWSLFAELDLGHRQEHEVRAELRRRTAATHTFSMAVAESGRTVAETVITKLGGTIGGSAAAFSGQNFDISRSTAAP